MATQESALKSQSKGKHRIWAAALVAVCNKFAAAAIFRVVGITKTCWQSIVLGLVLTAPIFLIGCLHWLSEYLPAGEWLQYLGWLPQHLRGGSWLGLFYGSVALLMIVVLMYFSARKRTYAAARGKLVDWLRSHQGIGSLVFLMVLYHSGFRLTDPVAVTSFVLLTLVALSGILGAWIYHSLPQEMMSVPAVQTLGRLSTEINHIASSIRQLGKGKSPEFNKLCNELIEEVERHPMGAAWRILLPSHRNTIMAPTEIRSMMSKPPGLNPVELKSLETLFERASRMKSLRDELILKQSYINWMRLWLYIHVPLSVLMLIFVLFHIVVAVSYLSWDNVIGF